MSLANLFNVPRTPQEWAVWSFSHMSQHREIVAALQKQRGLTVPEYILDPIPFQSLDEWAWRNQSMHNDMNEALGLGGFDLTGVDLEDEAQIAAWIRLEATDMQNASLVLNL